MQSKTISGQMTSMPLGVQGFNSRYSYHSSYALTKYTLRKIYGVFNYNRNIYSIFYYILYFPKGKNILYSYINQKNIV